MESDLQENHQVLVHDYQLQRNQPHVNSGLTRYRSAPSSYCTSILEREFCNQLFDRPSSPETERIFTGLMNSVGGGGAAVKDSFTQSVSPVSQNSSVKEKISSQSPVNDAMVIQQQRSNISSYSSAPQSFDRSSSKPPLPNPSLTSAMKADYPVGQGRLPHMRTGGVNHSNLIRYNSSPTGLLSQINMGDGYAAVRGMGNFGAGNDTSEEASFSTSSRLKNTMNYSSGLISPIAKIGVKSNEVNNNNNNIDSECLWDDSAISSDNMGGLKRFRDGEEQASSAENQSAAGNRPPPLTHHLSLPKTPAELAGIEKFFELSDSIPCRIRAKRGFATHPRSIAERVRRTKISERIRKLQELVPNMDRQTNTADMLDLAVDYIKDLQKQVQTLTDTRVKCTCLHKQQQQEQL